MSEYQKIKFSVVMANYNNGFYLEDAIESVIAQTYHNWELVIVDDCSTDNSVDVIKRFLSDAKIKLVTHDKNLGCGASKSDGIAHASGEFIGILDADDALAPNCLELVIKEFNHYPNCGMVYTTSYECDKTLQKEYITQWVGQIEPGKTNLHLSRISAFRSFTRSSYNLTSGIDRKLRSAVDKDLIYKIEEVSELRYLNKPLYYRRYNSNGISQGDHETSAYINCVIAMLEAFRRRKKRKFSNLSAEQMSTILIRATPLCLKESKFFLTFKFLMIGLLLYPRNLKIFIKYLIKILNFS
jgi:glycosyltransferase involved in cell wall biosynthesis